MGLDCKGTADLKDLVGIKDKLISQMLEQFPNGHYSIMINLWDDYTCRLQCRHGADNPDGETVTIHIWQYYKEEFTYFTEQTPKMLGTS